MKIWIVNWDRHGMTDFDGVFSTRENALEYARLLIQEKLVGLDGAMRENAPGYQERRQAWLDILTSLEQYVLELTVDSNLLAMHLRQFV